MTIHNTRSNFLGIQLDTAPPNESLPKIIEMIHEGQKGYICVSNVHQCMEAHDDPLFKEVLNSSSMTIIDSQVLAWGCKLLNGGKLLKPVRGMQIMLSLCAAAEAHGITIGLYGGSPTALEKLQKELFTKYPTLHINCSISPPYRKLTTEEDKTFLNTIRNSKVQLLFIGVGCPKQEQWMAKHTASLDCVMVGVGAAFDFVAGTTKASPSWVHPLGLEWLWRLAHEPKRLWKRYALHNPRFIWLLILQLAAKRKTHKKLT